MCFIARALLCIFQKWLYTMHVFLMEQQKNRLTRAVVHCTILHGYQIMQCWKLKAKSDVWIHPTLHTLSMVWPVFMPGLFIPECNRELYSSPHKLHLLFVCPSLPFKADLPGTIVDYALGQPIYSKGYLGQLFLPVINLCCSLKFAPGLKF